MNLDTGTYQPYRKPDNMPIYIYRKSNHCSTLIKDISSNEVVFNESIPIYLGTLRKRGFHDITFIPKTTNTKTNKSKSSKRRIIWFNLPYCLSAKTNVGRIFLKLTKKHFPNGNSLTLS